MDRKKSKKQIKSVNRIKQSEINFYRIHGASWAFIEFLMGSNSKSHISLMWFWLRNLINEEVGDERLIFPFFKEADENGYDLKFLASKLVNALIACDADSDEIGWLIDSFGLAVSDCLHNVVPGTEVTHTINRQVTSIHDSLTQDEGLVICVNGSSDSVGGILKLCNEEQFLDFTRRVVDRALEERSYDEILRKIHGLMADLIMSIDQSKELRAIDKP